MPRTRGRDAPRPRPPVPTTTCADATQKHIPLTPTRESDLGPLIVHFEPGPGMGGHCLPVDPLYLSRRARELDMTTEFIELAGKINQQMPYHCVAKVERALNDAGRPVKGSRIALLGVSYKPGVGDIRESPALKILTLLSALGAELRYHDPHVPTLPDHGLSSVPLEEALQDADLVLIVTAHPGVDHELVLQRARLVVDLRGITRGTRVENVVRL
jgi:UDP-N-acetyl-D-glucosamine dehydrogenase